MEPETLWPSSPSTHQDRQQPCQPLPAMSNMLPSSISNPVPLGEQCLSSEPRSDGTQVQRTLPSSSPPLPTSPNLPDLQRVAGPRHQVIPASRPAPIQMPGSPPLSI